MCGLAGFFGAGDSQDLQAMMDALTHRGPDAEGKWDLPKTGIHLGHRRLSIIDLQHGNQPMALPDGSLIVVYNGEIYNHLELRAELQALGHRFTTDHSDTEVLLHGYEEWGEDLPEKLNGMWAFAIYETSRNRLFLSRDRFGEKPLFYTRQNGTFAFASELKALLKHHRITSGISPLSLKKYYAYGYVPCPASLYEKIYKLPGGCNLSVSLSEDHFTLRRYWDFALNPMEKIPKNPQQEWGEEIRFLLHQSVKRRLMSDVPLGVFLSGGIDSSAIAAYAAKEMSDTALSTFSIGFEDVSFDESDWSKRMAGKLSTEHHQQRFPLEALVDLLPEMTLKLDEPVADSSLMPTFLLCKTARQKVKVALGGDGADELFAGYDPFRALRFAEFYSRLVPKPVHRAIRLLAARLPTSHKNISTDFILKRTLRGLSYPARTWNPVWLGPLEPTELQELFAEKIDLEEIYSEAIELWESNPGKNLVDRALEFYTKLYFQNDILVKLDRTSMLNSLEVRSPYLDVDLVDFVCQIPSNYKFRKGQTKYIFKKAMEPVLPREIVYRKKKGFGSPIGSWFKNGNLVFSSRSDSSARETDFFRNKFNEHLNGASDNRLYLWSRWLLEQSFPGR
ncbi:MAG: asparagine synthetase B [Nitrospinaceae bacterium]|nr:MAG: asparagine synthetase B [Nitrospinaceae bacterium]